MNSPETRHSLILKLTGERNELAWREFVASYEPFLKRLCERQGVPPRHTPDVTQQILATVARSVNQWRDDGHPESFRRWIHRVARNVVIRFMTQERRQAAGQGGSDLVSILQEIPDKPDRALETRYEQELIVWAAERIRGEFRETSWKAFWATLIEGRAVDDVAGELAVSPGSIYMSRSRIMARIRMLVAEVLDD